MATLSCKVPQALAERFERFAEDRDKSTSAALRELVELAVHYRRFEVDDETVGSPSEGVLFVRWSTFLDD